MKLVMKNLALKALLLAEQEIQNNRKEINSAIISSNQIILDEIETLKNKIQSFNHLQLRQIHKTLELDFIYKSIYLNGNSLTQEETKSVINDGSTVLGKSMEEHLEAINFQEATLHIKDLSQKKMAFSEKELLFLHNLIFKGIDKNSGKYKNDSLIIKEMNLFFNWYETQKNNLHPIILASEAHLKIITINPFENGNIQIANLVLNMILLLNNYVYVVAEGNIKSKNEYLFSIEESQNKNDKSIFINYVLKIEKQNLDKAIELTS